MSMLTGSRNERRAVVLACFGLLAITAAAYLSLYAALGLAAVLVVVLAMEVSAVPLLVGLLLVRELVDGSSGSQSRAGSHLSLSVVVAAAIILLALGAVLRRLVMPKAMGVALVAIAVGTLVALHDQGGSATVASREGIREVSILAIALIAYNSRAVSLERLVRICQWLGVLPALLAIYQLGTNSGMIVGHHHRAQATFSHPNSAAVFFAIPLMLSVWSLVERRRRDFDFGMTALYALATLATGSLGGLAGALVMLLMLSVARRTSLGAKVGMLVAGIGLAIAFALSPLGKARLAAESVSSANFVPGKSQNSFEWRLYNWKTLLPIWRQHPIFGSGLGTTTTGTTYTGKLPHNEYIRYLVETGLFGFVLVVLALVLLLAKFNRLRRAGDARVASAGAVGLAIVAGLAVNAFAANTVLYTPAIYLGTFVVAALARGVTVREPAPAPPPRRAVAV